jgi:ABC-type Fe3+/spermidine/putrescine transport system ATPase subunit
VSGLEVVDVEVRLGSFRLGPVRFEAPAGSATVVLGPSGAGKTTLLRGVAGFLPLESGVIRLNGETFDGRPPEERGLGFVPPTLGLFPHRTVAENVRYPLALRGDSAATGKARGWMERFDLLGLGGRYPSELSSGQRQRVAMARALAAEPRLLLWDEPLAALDVESRDTLVRLLRDFVESEELPLLLVTHDPGTALALASRSLVLSAGRVRFAGALDELARRPLDRFTARFLGYENLFSREELERSRDTPIGAALLAAAGPGGLAVPIEALRWAPEATPPVAARVAALHPASAGWRVAIRVGSLTFHVPAPSGIPTVHPGDAVRLAVALEQVKPLREGAAAENGR